MNEVPNRQKGKIMERNYEEIFQKVLDYEQALHEKNRKRIKIGLKCIWIVPLFFLALLFLTGSNKVIFLILWIVSLFALSIYLIVVEYMDYNLQEKIMELKGEEGDLKAVTPTDFDRAAQIIRETRKEGLLLLNDDIDLEDVQGELETRAKFMFTPLQRMIDSKEISSAEITVPEGQEETILEDETMRVKIRYLSRGYIREIEVDLGRSAPSSD